MKYKVILWDFDGTLANTGADVWDSLEYAAGKLGGSMDEKFKSCDSNLGKPMREIFRQVHPFPGEEKLATFDEWVTIHYRTISEYPKTELYPGIREILEEARVCGVRNYICLLYTSLETETVLLLQGDTDNLCTQQLCLSLIAGIGGIGDDDFISGI